MQHLFAGLSALLALRASGAQKTHEFVTAFDFDVSDTTERRSVSLDRQLELRVERYGALHQASAMGWTVAVSRKPVTGDNRRNLLYHSRSLHGAYPTDLYAWQWRTQLFGDVRSLPVYGYPYEVEVRCERCTVAGDGTDAYFTAGTVRVRWRTLPRANRPPV
jgi:hypothetical protein